ncbi:MAG: hypothetical protein ACRCXY_10920 [Fusobacteriaceae bacterium]
MLFFYISNSNFRDEVFILNNINKIFNYNVIKRALKMTVEIIKTKEAAKEILEGL